MGQDADGNEIVDSGETGTGENPAWQELYGILPDNLHGVIAPVLEKWEQGTNQKFEQYAETQKAYEPYQQFVDNEIPADQIEQALAVAQLIDSDPKGFMEQMKAFFGGDDSEQQTSSDHDDGGFEQQPFDMSNDPNFKRIAEQQDTIAGYLAQQIETERANQEDQQLEQDLAAMQEKYGDFNEDYVFGMVLNGVDLEAAVQHYKSFEENIRSAPRSDAGLPNILTPGGGMPSEQVNVAEMSEAQRKAFVMSVLAQANTT